MLSILLMALGCEEDAPANESLKATLTNSQTDHMADYLESDAFNLYDVRLEGTLLQLDVGYSGGCEEHDFYLVWPEGIDLPYPLEFDVYLAHDANGDMCEAYPRETLEIDIANNPLHLDAQTLSTTILGVVNTSNPDQTFYPND